MFGFIKEIFSVLRELVRKIPAGLEALNQGSSALERKVFTAQIRSTFYLLNTLLDSHEKIEELDSKKCDESFKEAEGLYGEYISRADIPKDPDLAESWKGLAARYYLMKSAL